MLRPELARSMVGDLIWLILAGFGAGCVVSVVLVFAGLLFTGVGPP